MNKSFIYLIVIYFCISCTSGNVNNKSKNENDILESPDALYILAKQSFDNQQYEIAENKFNQISKIYPLSNEAIQSEIMIGFINYIEMDYDNAIFNFKKIINKYPSHKDMDYVYYMLAMCNYEQLQNASLDGAFNQLALKSFNQVINRFPESKYAKDSRQKIILVKSNIAAKHIEIGRFYLKNKKYIAALNRFKKIVDEYSMTKFVPEALHRMVEAYYAIGMVEEASETASILNYNYPKSKWYKYSYDLIKNVDEDSFFKKITNVF